MKYRLITRWCFGLAVAGGMYCTSVNDIAGGSSSTDNGKVVGMVRGEDGLPASNTQVTLRSTLFNPNHDTVSSAMDTTDSEGMYAFDSLAAGIYTIEAVQLESRTRALVNSIMIDSTTTHAEVASLAQPGALKIELSGCVDESCYIYVPGTSLYGLVRDGIGFIDSVPAGLVPAVYYADQSDPSSIHTIKTGIIIGSGATRIIADNSAWSHSAQIILNTTESGADVAANVYDFPVLLRLSEKNFDFSTAGSNGNDLRFRKRDDTPLPYEIERWDATAGHAEVWVRVDTVFGNDSSRFFMMYWGNAAAASESNGTAVFDTIAGFQGVWHLADVGNDVVPDATGNHYDGTASNMSSVSPVEGVVGAARDFDGKSGYISMPATADSKLDFPQNGTYSMSLWAYADTIDSVFHAIAGKGHEQYYMQLKCLGEGRATWEFVEFQDQVGWEYTEDSTPPAPSSKNWVHLTGVRSGNEQHFYVNGELVIDTIALMAGDYARNTGDNFTIGRFSRSVAIPYQQGWSWFNGKVDEVRLMTRVLTDDEVRLCYMNQKSDDELVIIKRNSQK
jgi:hypothetical protein